MSREVAAVTKDGVPRCAETVWSNRDAQGNIVQGYVKDCPNRAKVLARRTGTVVWTPLCGRHENVDRWANYLDIEWRGLDGSPRPNPWEAVED